MPHSTFYILPSTLIRPFYILHFTFYIIFAFAMMSCTSSTKPKTGSLSGRVILVNDTGDPSLDPVDYSGVTVALYELAVLDTTITRISREYLSIGVQISQETEFDHRVQHVVCNTITSPDGSFHIQAVPIGRYNMVVFREGWGFRYVYDVEILTTSNRNDSDEKSTSNASKGRQKYFKHSPIDNTITLYPVRLMPSVITDPLVFEHGRVYMFISDTTVISDISISSGATLVIDAGSSLFLHGSVHIMDDLGFWRMTSSSGLSSLDYDNSIGKFNHVSFVSDNEVVEIKNMVIDMAVNGIYLQGSVFEIQNCIFRNTDSYGIYSTAQETHIRKCLFHANLQMGVSANNSGELVDSVLIDNRVSLYMQDTTYDVSNNYFIGSHMGIQLLYGDNNILNNNFDGNEYGVSVCGASPRIELNSFFQDQLNIELNKYHTYDWSSPKIERNNFFGSNIFISLEGHNNLYSGQNHVYLGVNSDQHYPHNFFFIQSVSSHLIDANHPDSETEHSFTISINPRRLVPIAEAGVQIRDSRKTVVSQRLV